MSTGTSNFISSQTKSRIIGGHPVNHEGAEPWLTLSQCDRVSVENWEVYATNPKLEAAIAIKNGINWTTACTLKDVRLWGPGQGKGVGVWFVPAERNNEYHQLIKTEVSGFNTGILIQHWNAFGIHMENCGTSRCNIGVGNVVLDPKTKNYVGYTEHQQTGSWKSHRHKGHCCKTVVHVTTVGAKLGIIDGDFEYCQMLFRLGAGEGSRDKEGNARFEDIRFDGKEAKVIGTSWWDGGVVLSQMQYCDGAVIFAMNRRAIEMDKATKKQVRVLPWPAVIEEKDGNKVARWWDPDRDNISRDAKEWPENWDFDWIKKRGWEF